MTLYIVSFLSKPSIFLSQLNTIQSQLGPILDDFNKFSPSIIKISVINEPLTLVIVFIFLPNKLLLPNNKFFKH